MTTKKQSLSEASMDILNAIRSKKDKLQDPPVTLADKNPDIGMTPRKKDDNFPDYTGKVSVAIMPGIKPDDASNSKQGVGAELPKIRKDTEGRMDLIDTQQMDATNMQDVQDRIMGKLPQQKFEKRPGSHFPTQGDHQYGESVDMSDDVNALLEGENLSEEFKTKATTIFEAAVMSRVQSIAEQIESDLQEQFETAVETVKEELADKMDDYLNYVVEEWITENKLAIDSGLRSELAEDFITGLRTLFVEHFIDVPEDKVDIVEELANKVSELEDELNAQLNEAIAIKKELQEHKKIETIYTASEGLSQAQVEKLKSLTESIEFTTEEEFVVKINTLKESYFSNSVKSASNNSLDDEVLLEEKEKTKVKSDSLIESYAHSISKSLK